MKENWQKLVSKHLSATNVKRGATIQSLWSGYGEIFRVHLEGCEIKSLVIKHIAIQSTTNHPRGWDSELSTERKIQSYKIECHWYEHWSDRCQASRVAKCYATDTHGPERWIVLEDLDASGFDGRFSTLDKESAEICIRWLARFHAEFLKSTPTGLWPTGTYWHLETRPDEYRAMPTSKLKTAAHQIDKALNTCKFQTIVHGDAKVANFCFSKDKKDVAAVDFQYVGKGCGIKDLAYFIGSCLDEESCELLAPSLLDGYFKEFRLHSNDKDVDLDELEEEWRTLYPLAWTDFYRFLAGWMPTHPKIHGYTKDQAETTFKYLSSMDDSSTL